MKTIRLAFLLVISMFITLNVVAQTPLTFGVKAGLNLSEIENMSDDIKVGFNVGATVDYQFTEKFYLMSGLELTTKGAKNAALNHNISNPSSSSVLPSQTSTYKDVKLNSMYLQIPIHVGYKLDIAKDTKLVLRAGPNVAYGIAGKIKGEYSLITGGDAISMHKLDMDYFEDGVNRFELSMAGGVGIEYGKICATLGADWALTKTFKDSNMRNRSASLSVGYKF